MKAYVKFENYQIFLGAGNTFQISNFKHSMNVRL